MKLQDGHLHAWSLYKPITKGHFLRLLASVVVGRILFVKSITVHLPLEILHPKQYKNQRLALCFIEFGQCLRDLTKIKLYWENAPLLKYGSWDLKYGQNSWNLIPNDIDLCLDTGHLMLGAKNVHIARKRIKEVILQRGSQIKHLHIHENNLRNDSHNKIGKIVNAKIFSEIIKDKSYIFEP
jgi:sugar phosphate isomerase/epimerase